MEPILNPAFLVTVYRYFSLERKKSETRQKWVEPIKLEHHIRKTNSKYECKRKKSVREVETYFFVCFSLQNLFEILLIWKYGAHGLLLNFVRDAFSWFWCWLFYVYIHWLYTLHVYAVAAATNEDIRTTSSSKQRSHLIRKTVKSK